MSATYGGPRMLRCFFLDFGTSSKIHASVFEPQRRVGCRRTRRENEANAVLSATVCIGACSCSLAVIWLVPCIATLHEPDHTLHAPVSTRKHGVGPPHHLTTSPPHHLTSPRRKKHANPPTTRFFVYFTAPKRSVEPLPKIWLVTLSSCVLHEPDLSLHAPVSSWKHVVGAC